MKVNQLSVFVENKSGRLAAILQSLASNGIDISALSLADTSDFGVLRLIVSDTSKAKDVLTKSGVIVKITEVLAVGMDDTPGGAYGIVDLMASAGIDVEYMYACTSSVPGKALMVFKPSKLDEAEAVLSKNHFGAVKPEEIYRI